MQRFSVRLVLVFVGAFLCISGSAIAQSAEDQEPERDSRIQRNFGSGIGMNILLTNNGFGLGGYYLQAVSPTLSVYAEFGLTPGKDENEQKFFGYFGESIIPGKYNYFMMMPITVGVQRRMFKDSIEENFRPFVQISGGPTFGWSWPYFDDREGNQQLDPGDRIYDVISSFHKGAPKFGMGASVGFGAQFGSSRRSTQGIRLGYSFSYFFQDVQLMEPRRKDAQHFFGTPTISLFFGRLW